MTFAIEDDLLKIDPPEPKAKVVKNVVLWNRIKRKRPPAMAASITPVRCAGAGV